jgi:hypothetical protein
MMSSVASLVAQPAASEAPQQVAQPISGRVDAIADRRVLGWAWHPGHPQERLLIECLIDGRKVASVTADQSRIDLKRNGIGDGSHAFDFELTDDAAADIERLQFRALATNGESMVLRVASIDERAAEAAISVPLTRVLERLDLLLSVSRQLVLGQRETFTSTKSLTDRVSKLSSEGGTIETAISQVAESQGDVASRVATIEVFLKRFDTTLASFDQRLTALQTLGKHEVKPIVIILATLLGVVAGVILTSLVR